MQLWIFIVAIMFVVAIMVGQHLGYVVLP